MNLTVNQSRAKNANKSGKMFVENLSVIDDLVQTAQNSPRLPRRIKTVYIGEERATTPVKIQQLREMSLRRDIQTESMMKLNIQKSLESEAIKRDKKFPILLENVESAQQFLNHVEKDLHLHDETKRNKARRQYEEWNTQVHGVIQKQIAKTINGYDSQEINRKKNEDYEKFLNITNKKAAIFRDIIIESEYDPLEPNRNSIRAKTGKLKDPMKIDAQKASLEASMLGIDKNKSRESNKLGKETLPVELWASGQIEATPYGSYARMMNSKNKRESRMKVRDDGELFVEQTRSATMQSHIVFDHFDYPFGREAILKELPRGKRVHKITKDSDSSRVFNTLPGYKERRQLAELNAKDLIESSD